ncbi:MAG: hypothetical protein RXS23_05695 [Metallosphaera yellowstonensis]|jgi:hypothetical protein|uniref:Uncharacterized protein n=1 Tax=Metallosphaera yellowstonensis MK1 TaxID=671065 RepID=H2C4I3_9CREN|nr:hypothetical protein [Metallosphaera yellowstonensis]EHP71001.1 hypothetical protein MetMK1DRAFT_00015050 [Metallosphaera yellowstonensis MK1]
MSGVFSLIVLGIGWQEVVSWLDLYYLSSVEIKLIFIIIFYFLILGVLEGIVVYAGAFLVMVEVIPYVIIIMARKIFR